jgi:hypothetical protein
MQGISAHKSQKPTAAAQVHTVNITEKFKSTFSLTGQSAQTVSMQDKGQALVLLERITNSAPKGPIESHQDKTLSLRQIPKIPYINDHHDLISTLNDGLKDHPKIKERLSASIETWERKRFTLTSEKRPGFIERDDNKETIRLTRDTVSQRQAPSSLGQKYDNKSTLFEPSLQQAIDSDYAEIDHMDPWSKIVKRIQDCVSFINTFPNHEVKTMLQNAIKAKHPHFFIASGSSVQPTHYLAACLYNHTDNLLGINHPGNTKKNDAAAIPWLAKHPEFGAAFLAEISTTPLTTQESADPTDTLNKLTNQTNQSIGIHPKTLQRHRDQTRIPRPWAGLCRWYFQEKTNPWRQRKYRNTTATKLYEIHCDHQSNRAGHQTSRTSKST